MPALSQVVAHQQPVGDICIDFLYKSHSVAEDVNSLIWSQRSLSKKSAMAMFDEAFGRTNSAGYSVRVSIAAVRYVRFDTVASAMGSHLHHPFPRL